MTRKIKEDYTLNYKWLENDLSKSSKLTSVSNSDDYRRISLYPTLEDITNGPPALCANKIDRPYKNCDEYLNNFFRLMREDFISIIRDTLKSINANKRVSEPQIDRLWYYSNVKIINKKTSVTMYLQFDTPSRAKTFNYEDSKRFKNGALLLLSKDLFATFSLGIVTDTFRLNKGIVGVDVVDFEEVNKWSWIDLLEPDVFYEPYRYVLAVFQDLYESNFPMKNYIVHGIKKISHPSYLIDNSVYTINGITFDILQNDQWPSAEIFNMDINQYQAFKGALTKEFTMIQGPPGTGKTYIGLEIVKVIIENMYNTKKLNHPIMVVCMTNHALDQFLEGIWKITRNISRFGRGTKSDILVNYIPTMSVARKDECANIYVDAKRDVKASIQKENEHLINIKEIDRNEGIVDLSLLMQVLNKNGFNTWFKNSYDLLAWLLHDISSVNGINPIDFIKKDDLLATRLSKLNKNEANTKVYFITLKSIKLYCTQVQCQLKDMNRNVKDDNVSKKKDLENALKIMKTVEDDIVKHLKLFKSGSSMIYETLNNRDLLGKRDRWLLYYNWVRLYITNEYNNIENIKDTTRQCRRDMNKFKSIGYLKPVQNKYVIGMTTTAAAKNRYLLKNLKCPIVIIEEAAEVLEPHIVASLSEYCEHLILIGDHKQLRPQTANHNIGKKYRLDISLFERMVNNKIPSYVLAEQHRMRPEIAGLVAPVIYPHLRNHASVMKRPHVKGVSMNVFCMTHNEHEEKDYELSSFVNRAEATYLVALANYLLKQGYYPEDITIMAMYNAQVVYISNLIKSPPYEHLADIRVSSVDGYQGEENEIVLLSLVRSNNNYSIGFLKTNNRVCVALSRARLGFYIAGDLKLLARASKLWSSVKTYLSNLHALGPKLLLKCQIHNKIIGSASNDLDFQMLTLCQLKCNVKLSCGHLCQRLCHVEDSDHLTVKCLNMCNRKCPRNHKCRRMCYEDCSCQVSISQINDCGHIIQGKCCDVENIKCDFKVNKTLSCGHTLEKKCFEQLNCNQICKKPNSNCLFRHLCKKPCGVNCGSCVHLIPIIMKCGHISEFSCSQEPDTVECLECKVY
ncbi:NFX1-type zinc finger-containing protein 1-like [Aphis gossypii]|uniref:NFX1-type zinc finger-containing protein 1-like n=1 Tax=Aphis gossypii TaxID=80765 RepID=UPI002158DDAC|nr:NFX1-type zinc finger-containing protein 1-like [Aphis gossypii]XP_050060550.1 NFX1-type zinc finger-containing protein 1-like [Aphis gossypii]XP_050060551.1 NFX1-type zinc finger-containing protein 1-like [Aphis gossypii]XP_050060552.1 NFX1-type zinc finger-containing protein 1-like [Aphis gossypii]